MNYYLMIFVVTIVILMVAVCATLIIIYLLRKISNRKQAQKVEFYSDLTTTEKLLRK
jgi:hypothetical protein